MLRKGFTLIELLLVIAIIGILAAIVLAGVASTRSKARDAARLMDLRSIASVLEFFYTDKGHYPVAEGWVTGCDAAGANWLPEGNPTNESPIPLVITFSRSVVDFSQESLSVLRGVISGFSAVLADLFNVFVTPTDNNTVVVSVTGGAVHDARGIGNTAAQFTITYDSLLPHPALSPDPLPEVVSEPFLVSVNFTVEVVDFLAGSMSVTNGTITNFSEQNGSNYTFTVTPTAPGPADAAHSAAGNASVASNTLTTTYAGQ